MLSCLLVAQLQTYIKLKNDVGILEQRANERYNSCEHMQVLQAVGDLVGGKFDEKRHELVLPWVLCERLERRGAQRRRVTQQRLGNVFEQKLLLAAENLCGMSGVEAHMG